MGAEWIASALTVLLDTSWRAALLTALVGLVLTAARAQASAVRHRAWCLVLVAVLLMPALSSMAPKFEVPVPVSALLSERALDGDPALPPDDSQPAASRVASTPSPGAKPAAAAPLSPPRTDLGAARNVDFVRPTLLLLYVTGVLWCLGRLVFGWRGATRLLRQAFPTDIDDALESPAVSTPVTVGVVRPRIVLPSSWRTWSSDQLLAILAHERAHVKRRDPLTAVAARVNRSLLWFHPAAWWIERRLTIEAEHACDEAGVDAIGAAREYAAILVEMADVVRRHGGRIIQPSLGVEGNGLLGRRIDRVLRGSRGARVSRFRKAMVASGCTAAVAVAVSCTGQAPAAPPLRENRDVARQQAQYRNNEALLSRVDRMELADLDALEASLKQKPGDIEAWKALKWFYMRRGPALLGWNEMTDRRLPYVTMLIDQLPDNPESIWRVTDPAGSAAAAAAWHAHASAPNASTAALANAAAFFSTRDLPEAERLLLRLRASDPAAADRWSRRLGELYAEVILGPRSQQDGRPTTPFDNDPSAKQVFARLLASSDVETVATAGSRVIRGAFFDPGRTALGRQLTERALALDPANLPARQVLLADEQLERMRRLAAAQAQLAGLADKVQRGERLTPDENARLRARALEAARAMAETERLWALLEIAEREVMWAENLEHSSKDAAAIAGTLAQSKQAATDALALAPSFRGGPGYGSAIYRANVALGVHALREGHRDESVRYMRAAAAAPASQILAVDPSPGLSMRLVNYLLKEGERRSVVEFLEQSAVLRTVARQRLLADAAAVRAGEMPPSYQFVMAAR